MNRHDIQLRRFLEYHHLHDYTLNTPYFKEPQRCIGEIDAFQYRDNSWVIIEYKSVFNERLFSKGYKQLERARDYLVQEGQKYELILAWENCNYIVIESGKKVLTK